MWNAEGNDQERLVPYTGSPVKAEKKSRTKPLIMIAVGAIIFVIVGMYYLGYFSTMPEPTGGTQTWHQYGMSISYPAGLSPQLSGIYEQQATNSNGQVQWIWNQANTALALTWVNATHADLEAGIQSLYDVLSEAYTSVTLVERGNVTICVASWPYVTYSYNATGQIYYQTMAIYFYASESRFYEIDFVDTNSNTLSSLMTYASAFAG